MALVVRNGRRNNATSASSTNPTKILALALHDFESVLTDEQKLVFQGQFAKPESGDVIAFVSRIDADSKGRAQRCVAPRLCTFLESVVQFSGVVDTFVQSNPAIAALVWGSVKATLVAASNVTSYFEKVTGMIMHVGRLTPTLQRFGQLYPGSNTLQAALCDYYAIIIRLCTKIILNSQRTNIAQLLSPILTPFETEFKVFIDDLAQAGRLVDIQISLASKVAAAEEIKCAELERKKNSDHRRFVDLFQTDVRKELEALKLKNSLRDQEKLRSSINAQLSSFDCVASWRQAKGKLSPGTAEWFQHDDSYLQWYSSSTSSILACYGKLGSGKSVFMSNVISHLQATRTTQTIVSHLFCRFDDIETLDARSVVGCICRQLLRPYLTTMTHDDLKDIDEEIQGLSGALQLVERVVSQLHEDRLHFVVIDGLDELESKELSLLSKCLLHLRRGSHTKIFKILISSRTALERSYAEFMHSDYTMQIVGQPVAQDIERFVKTALDQNLADGTLTLADPTLILEIVKALCLGANGMFLWARLLIDEVCEQQSDKEIRLTLASLPKALSDLFDRKLTRIRAHSAGTTMINILQFCGVARRPLRLTELREVLTVKVGQRHLTNGDLINNIQGIVDACRGLLEVDEENFSVHFVHFSVKQHLFSATDDGNEFNTDFQDQNFGYLCLTYLNFTNFESQIENIKLVSDDSGFTALDMGLSAAGLSKPVSQLARHLLQSFSSDKPLVVKETFAQLQHVMKKPQSHSTDGNFSFLPYAQSNWIYHLKQPLDPENHQLLDGFISCVFGPNKLATRPWLSELDIPLLMDASEHLVWLECGFWNFWKWVAANSIGSFFSRTICGRMQIDSLDKQEIIELCNTLCLSQQQKSFETLLSYSIWRFSSLSSFCGLLGAILKTTAGLYDEVGGNCLRFVLRLQPPHLAWAHFCIVLRHTLANHCFSEARYLLEAANPELLQVFQLRDIVLHLAIILNIELLVKLLWAELPFAYRRLNSYLLLGLEARMPEITTQELGKLFPPRPSDETQSDSIMAFFKSVRRVAQYDWIGLERLQSHGEMVWVPELCNGHRLMIAEHGASGRIEYRVPVISEQQKLTQTLPLVIAASSNAFRAASVLLEKALSPKAPLLALQEAIKRGNASFVPLLFPYVAAEDLSSLEGACIIAVETGERMLISLIIEQIQSHCIKNPRSTGPPYGLRMLFRALIIVVSARSEELLWSLMPHFNSFLLHAAITLVQGPVEFSTAQMSEFVAKKYLTPILTAIPLDVFDPRAWSFVRSLMRDRTASRRSLSDPLGLVYEMPHR